MTSKEEFSIIESAWSRTLMDGLWIYDGERECPTPQEVKDFGKQVQAETLKRAREGIEEKIRFLQEQSTDSPYFDSLIKGMQWALDTITKIEETS